MRQLVVGTITRAEADVWQASALLVDTETAETLRAETLNFNGTYRDLLFQGMDRLARRIALTGAEGPAPQSAAARPESEYQPPTSWHVKWMGGLALGLAAAYVGYAEAQATTRSNDKQKTILDDMTAATSSAEYSSLKKQLKSEEDAAATHKTNSDLGYAIGLALIGWAAWVYLNPPPAENPTALSPLLVPGPDVARVGIAVRW